MLRKNKFEVESTEYLEVPHYWCQNIDKNEETSQHRRWKTHGKGDGHRLFHFIHIPDTMILEPPPFKIAQPKTTHSKINDMRNTGKKTCKPCLVTHTQIKLLNNF